MAKGARSKTTQRQRRLKRSMLEGAVDRRLQRLKAVTDAIDRGTYSTPHVKKSAFLHPDDPEAVVPQVDRTPPVDFRSEALMASGLYESVQAKRKRVSARRQ